MAKKNDGIMPGRGENNKKERVSFEMGSELLEKFDNKLLQERQDELTQMSKGNIDQSKFQEVRDMLSDRSIEQQSNFTDGRKKQNGLSEGYIAQKKDTKDTHILKHFYKTEEECYKREINTEALIQDLQDRKDGVRELLSSSLYQFLLYDRAPKVGLVIPNDANPHSLYVRSKFFNQDAVNMRHFRSSNKIEGFEGFEKLVASCQMLGETDYHDDNIMIQIRQDEKGQEYGAFVKVDHGRSLIGFNQDFKALVNKMATKFIDFEYDQEIRDGNLLFNIDKYSNALKQMVTQLSPDQIDSIVDQKIAELKKTEFDPKGLKLSYNFGDSDIENVDVNIQTFDDLASTFKDSLKKNLSNMKEISKQVEIITKFEGVSEKFKNGGWIQELSKSRIIDPVAYASHNNIKIEGKNALEWAHLNDYKIPVVTKEKELSKVLESNNFLEIYFKKTPEPQPSIKSDIASLPKEPQPPQKVSLVELAKPVSDSLKLNELKRIEYIHSNAATVLEERAQKQKKGSRGK